jgi:hypothetical protein
VAKRSEFVKAFPGARDPRWRWGGIEPGWGGGSTVGGAPRNADGSRSRLTPQQVFDAVERVLGGPIVAVAAASADH